jgi:hypothetical protein
MINRMITTGQLDELGDVYQTEADARQVESASHGLLAERLVTSWVRNGSKPVGLLELVTRQDETRQR